MSFPRYGEYKDSGVEWLGEIPMHWEVLPAKRRFQRKKELNSGMACENRLALTMSGVIPRDLDDLEGLQASEFETYQIFQPQDLAFKLIDLQNIKTSRVGLVPEAGIMSPAYIRLEPDKSKVEPPFAYWYFTDLYNRHIFNQLGGGVRQTLGPEELRCLPYPILSLPEQRSIASFLDRETSKIDSLVAEQRRLIELLKEKRQAVISHAVTKGLDPNVKMKPSGIEWLGDVPEHWEAVKLGHRGRLQNGLSIGGEAFGTGDPFVSYGDVYNNATIPDTPSGLVRSSAQDQSKCSLEAGDILFTRTSETVDDIGVASTCLRSLPRSTFAGFLIRFRPYQGILAPRYSTYLFRNQGVQGHFAGTMNLVTGASLSQGELRNLPICIPPLEEQHEIGSALDAQTLLLHGLVAEAERAITLLQERRTALISAAVTGKIDVRKIANTESVA